MDGKWSPRLTKMENRIREYLKLVNRLSLEMIKHRDDVHLGRRNLYLSKIMKNTKMSKL